MSFLETRQGSLTSNGGLSAWTKSQHLYSWRLQMSLEHDGLPLSEKPGFTAICQHGRAKLVDK
jgi:hypothetical protein